LEELDQSAVRGPFAELLSRRQILKRASVLGLGGMVASALPAAERLLATVAPAAAAVTPTDATLQAFADTIVPGRRAYVHIVRGSADVNGQSLMAGDAAKIEDEATIHVDHASAAEILLFDLP